MNRSNTYTHVVFAAILSVTSLLLLYFSPDFSSMIFVGIMTILVVLGYILGILRVHSFAHGFRFASKKMKGLKSISTEDNWTYIKQLDSFFNYSKLDKIFKNYYREVEMTTKDETAFISDIEDHINEDVLEVKCLKSIVDSIPGILTGLGILGTFYGLIKGLGGIRFSSVDVVVESISVLVTGIDTAFFTSIAGVIFSILFELMIKAEWNSLLDSMDSFIEKFHWCVIPSTSMQQNKQQLSFYQAILKKLDEVGYEKK